MIFTTYMSKLRSIDPSKIGKLYYICNFLPDTIILRNNHKHVTSLAPSVKLMRAFKNKEIDFEMFAGRYTAEVTNYSKECLEKLAELSKKENIFLVCYEKDSSVCHRSVLSDILKFQFNAECEEY